MHARTIRKSLVALGSLFAAVAVTSVALAQAPAPMTGPAKQHHDSNTLSKIGKALQYPIRKDTNNLSVDTHRAEGRNSVVRRHNNVVAHNEEIKPNGHIILAHRRHRHYYWRNGHEYYHSH